MKKIISILGAIGLVTVSSTSVIACGPGSEKKPSTQKVDISTKIQDTIYLRQLSDNTVTAFKTALQANLITIQDLNSISTSDYDVYKAGAGENLMTDSDIATGDSLSIKIIAKGDTFTGTKDNITANYSKVTQKIDINTETLKLNLNFTKTMNGIEAYEELRNEIMKLSNGVYKSTNEIRLDYTILISIWVSPTDTLLETAVSNLSSINTVDVKVQVNEDNKVFKELNLVTLNCLITENRSDLDTIIIIKDLEGIYIGQKDKPSKKEILEAIKDKNTKASSLTENNFDFKQGITPNTTTAIIVGTGNYKGEVTVNYNVINFTAVLGITEAVWTMAISKDGTIYVGTANGDTGEGHLYTKNASESTFTAVPGITEAVSKIFIDYDNNIFVGTASKGFSKGEGHFYTKSASESTFTAVPEISEAVWTMAISNDGTIYVGTKNGNRTGHLYTKSVSESKFTAVSEITEIIWTMAISKDGTIYVGTANGAGEGILYKKSASESTFTAVPGITEAVWTMAISNDGTIYVGTYSRYFSGHLYTKSASESTFTAVPEINHSVSSLIFDKNNNIYAGIQQSQNSGIVIKSTDKGSNFTSVLGITEAVWTMAISKNGTIYAGTINGVPGQGHLYKSEIKP